MLRFVFIACMFFALSKSDVIEIRTKGADVDHEYQCFPRRSNVNVLKFSLQAKEEAKILLGSSCRTDDVPYYEIAIGCEENTVSYIQKQEGFKVFERQGSLINPNEVNEIWVRLIPNEGRIVVGKGPLNSAPFMDYQDEHYQKTDYFAVTTYGNGVWKFENMIANCASCSSTRNIHIHTEDARYGYQYFPLKQNNLELIVKSSDEVKIVLAKSSNLTGAKYCEIVLGADNNTKSLIRTDPTRIVYEVPGSVVSPFEFINLKLLINRGVGRIRISKGRSNVPFIDYQHNDCSGMQVFGLSSTKVEAVWEINPGWITNSMKCNRN